MIGGFKIMDDFYELFFGFQFFTTIVTSLVISLVLGFIPAGIAKEKGYNFGLWWLYGFLLFIVAIIHVSLLPNKGELLGLSENSNFGTNQSQKNLNTSFSYGVAEELKKYKELLDDGAITSSEYEAKKTELLKRI